jgi:multidrug efflux system outer membrane protein
MRHLTLLVATAALAACASGPQVADVRPAATTFIAAAWQAPAPQGGDAQDLAQWWSRVDDPVLPALIDAAQSISATLSVASSRIAAARAARVAAGADVAVQGSASALRGRPDLASPSSNSIGLSAQAQWDLDPFGARRAARQAADARYEGAQDRWHEARINLNAEVATEYLALRACEAQLEQRQTDAASRAETARLIGLTAQAGLASPADAALARASAAQTRSQVVQQSTRCQASIKALVALTALEEAALRDRLSPFRARLPQFAPIDLPALPASLLKQRPDLAEAERTLVAAAADEQQARAQRWPQVSISGTLGASRLTTSNVRLEGSTWSLGPVQISLPIFDGGTREAQVGAARAAYDDAVVQYQARVRQAVREVEEALLALDSARQREVDAQVAADGFEQALRATEARHRGGLASLLELEDTRRTAIAARAALIDLRQDRLGAWISLYRALGGGWSPSQTVSTAPAGSRQER